MNNLPPHTSHHYFVFAHTSIAGLTETRLAQCIPNGIYIDTSILPHIAAEQLGLNEGVFAYANSIMAYPPVTVQQQNGQLVVSCGCAAERGLLCEHEATILLAILRRPELNLFFNPTLRHQEFKKKAVDYGLENEPDLDQYFEARWENRSVTIKAKLPALVPVTLEQMGMMLDVLNVANDAIPQTHTPENGQAIAVVLKKHKYYGHLVVELYKAAVTKEGKPKNPLAPLSPLDFIWSSEDPDHVKFFSGVSKFQNLPDSKRSASGLAALKAIVRNPHTYSFYRHDNSVSENVTATSITPVQVKSYTGSVNLSVNRVGHFYELSGHLTIHHTACTLKDMNLVYSYFLEDGNTLYLVAQLPILGAIDLLKKMPDNLLVHASKYREFKDKVLHQLEDHINIQYQYVPPATAEQLAQQGFHHQTEKAVYLSDFGKYVMIIPVMRYADVEIPIRTKRQIYGLDTEGREFMVQRNDEKENDFTALLMKQHPHFAEQMYQNDLHYFYLHKDRFMDENWFLNAFEEWTSHGIAVLGFNELEGNKLNQHKAKVDIKVRSGLNWFNALIQVRFGSKRASLKHIQKSLRNKSKYVQLDDGTMGILPEEWMKKFAAYFDSGEIIDEETLRIPHINYTAIDDHYEEDMLDEPVKLELNRYRQQLNGFTSISEVPVPTGLQATLRDYQQQGLNWLNFLDDFNFGGCLADDMGLGKSIQIIAFILSQRSKVQQNTNLLVVPATLIFNWQQELKRFAPSITLHTIYGTDRIKDTTGFDAYEVILTSYGTLLTDINFLKHYTFNYIFLDESQYIKNPETQRYKTVRQLQARNRIVITGTPIENNTFDLFGQLSFACPGLLGSKQYFRDVYSTPIDVFKDSKRAVALQQKVKPFILRRTKQEVASELPEKTEMVLYCDMMPKQREIYDVYEKQFRDYISATNGDELSKRQVHVLKGLTQLRQICNAPILLGDDEVTDSPSAKMDLLMEQIEAQTPGHKILVFSQFVGMLNLIKQELVQRGIGFDMLTGSTRNREAVVHSFQTDPQSRVFLISLKAGGTGLNLTMADYVYLVDPWWNPAVENQAIDRVHRIGQNKKVIAVRLICRKTVEEKILIMQESKRNLSGSLVQADTSFFRNMDKAGLMQLLGAG